MKNLYSIFSILFLLLVPSVMAQQLPNSQFEDWSGATFKDVAQPKSWNYSNVTQLGFEFNFAHKETGHNGGYCMMVQDQDLEVMGIGETSPGYIALGHPWVYIESLTKVSEATAGTYGGMAWTYRPDTMAVWIKRTGDHWMDEDFHLLYYAWIGTAHADSYKGKNGKCTSVGKDDEESDIRLSTNGNECGTATPVQQVSEGWLYTRAKYEDWVQIKVPIFYMDNRVPEKVNVIFSASNYPNFRANSGLYAGNSLYVDDLELIYSSKIHKLYVDGNEWKGFDPNNTDIQYYSLGESATTLPSIKAYRGAGQLTNSRNVTTQYLGRQLQGEEITITMGDIDNTPTLITVRAEDGSSETTYQIQFVHKASSNAFLSSIEVNGKPISNFNPYLTNYVAEVEYGTTSAPVISVIPQEDKQTVTFTQPTSINDTTVITVLAADKKTTQTYTVRYKEALLTDNTLVGINVNGTPLPDFVPTKTSYKVSLPIGTTEMPTVEGISKYAAGAQTITYTAPATIDGGTYQIAVSTPGNPTAKIYKITFKLEASSNCQLQDILLDGVSLKDFNPQTTTYYVALPIGTTTLPAITWVQGDAYQTVELTTAGVEGTTRITVTAANGDILVYKIVFSTRKSDISTLKGIKLNGEPLATFDANITSYQIVLPIGTTSLPTIEVIPADAYQTISIVQGDLNGVTRITVTAGNGATTIYQLYFSVEQSTDATLQNIFVDGEPLPGFSPTQLEYTYILPQGTTELPLITYVAHDAYQTISTRSGGVNGDYKITVRPQSGPSQTYIIHFSVPKASNTALQMIYLDGEELDGFNPDKLNYTDTLDKNIIPTVTYQAYAGQKVISLLDDNVHTIKVTAESGDTRTYTITFVVRKSENAFLRMIYLDGDSLKGFQFDRLSYTNIPLSSNTCPKITVDSEADQQICILSPAGAGTARIIVTAGAGGQNTYMLNFVDTTITPVQPLDPDPEYILSKDATLKAILIDGENLSTFSATQKSYSLSLAAGAHMPTVSFVPNTDKQSVIAGPINANIYTAYVTAENGDTANYTVTIQIAPYDNALLKDLQIEGKSIVFAPTTFAYNIDWIEGDALPAIQYSTNIGQTAVFNTKDNQTQEIIVTAESGQQNIYTINYTCTKSNNALLKDLLVDGVKIAGFDPQRFSYTDTLAWRTSFVPTINAIASRKDQTITTYHSAVNGVSLIHVVAADGTTTADYRIAFPTRKSSNNKLNDISLETEYAVELDFKAEQTDYTITLPYNATLSPRIRYEKAEPEQTIAMELRGMGEANTIEVQAEDGSTRTYSITFQRAAAPANCLQSIFIAELGKTLELSANQFNYSVALPYGTTSMTVSYTKQYKEQTVWVQPGGVIEPTLLTLMAPGQSTVTYSLYPEVASVYPASLTSLSVDGTVVEDFDPARFNYIVNRTNTTGMPMVVGEHDVATSVSYETNLWKSIITVTNGEYTTTYTVFFHYPDEIIPNGEFDNWSKTAVSNSDKPTSWNVPGDYLGTYLGTAKAGNAISRNGSSVQFSTLYWGALYGAVPPVINLATMTANFAVAGATTVTPSGAIGFHNTPDQAIINYKYPDKAGNGALFRFHFVDVNNKEYNVDHQQNNETSNYKDYTIDLKTQNKQIFGMDIIVDATGLYPKAPTGPLNDCDAELDLDYIRLVYDNTLDKVFVNDAEAQKDGNQFTYTLADATQTMLPRLSFQGAVPDQAQAIHWDAPVVEGTNSIRRATITNYGEDGLSSEYILSVSRPVDTNSALYNLQVNGSKLADFQADQLNYTYPLETPNTSIPDVMPILASPLQTCTINYEDSIVTITVVPEQGQERVYTIRFVAPLVEDASLMDIQAEGMQFTATQTDYTITANSMPAISVSKKYDQQIVTIQHGVIDVTMGNAKQQYRIQLQQPVITTSGQLKEIELDNNLMTDFASDKYVYQHAIPTTMNFVRKDASDSVIVYRTADTLLWRVIGSQEHTYQLTAPDDLAHSTLLKGIYVNGQLLNGFSAQIKEYTLYTDSMCHISVEGADIRQQIDITYQASTYTISVTAADGTAGEPYSLTLSKILSSDASLSSLLIDGDSLEDFQPNTYQYTIEIPCGTYKDHEPVLPYIQYATSNSNATVEVVANGINETTYLFVTAEDGMHSATYELYVLSEPSHNADLRAIAINDVPLENFSAERTFYTVQMPPQTITLDWRSEDRYQTVTQRIDGQQHILHVVAQDGITSQDYVIEIIPQTLSNDSTLSNILLDGQQMSEYRKDLNKDLVFLSGLTKYTIYLPTGTTNLPNVSATLKLDGQNVQIRYEQTTIYIDVTAPDGVSTSTYTLHFATALSSNTDLKMIYLDGDSLAGFNAKQLQYFITLPSTKRSLPDIYVQGDKSQTITMDTTNIETLGQQVRITVVAENGVASSQYLLLFRFTLSNADTLNLIYNEHYEPIAGFDPHRFYYAIEIPYDTLDFPTLYWETADAYQTVVVDTIESTTLKLVRQYIVTAENGQSNRYTISYTKLLSTNTSLKMIYVNNKPLDGFQPTITEYIDTLAAGEKIDTVFWELGDAYQTVEYIDTIPSGMQHEAVTIYLKVSAQNGDTRTYTMHYIEQPNTDSTLLMVYYNQQAVARFDEEIFDYTIQLQRDETLWPSIRYDKKNSEQTVDMQYVDSTRTILLIVTAADKIAKATYRFTFLPYLSDNGLLDAIYTDGTLLDDFSPWQDSYDVNVDSLKNMPELTYKLAEQTQHVIMDTTYVYNTDSLPRDIIIRLQVIPENQIDTNSYYVTFHIKENTPRRPEESDNAYLQTILVKGQQISKATGFNSDFEPTVLDYFYTYPIGSNPDLFFVSTDIIGIPQDSLAQVLGYNTEVLRTAVDTAGIEVVVQSCIHITVLAPNANTCTYNIYQKLELDSLNHTIQLIIADYLGVPRALSEFDPDIFYYEYTLSDTRYTAPDFELIYDNTDSRFANAYFERDNNSRVVDGDDDTNYALIDTEDDPTFHLCYRAENGTKFMYKIKFRRSEIKRAQTPMEGDVLIQHIPGSCQIAVASLRANVVFGLYDMNGSMIEQIKLEEGNPNSFVTTTDGFGQTYFGHLSELNSVAILTLKPNKIYFWTFTENGKRKIKSGKLVITQ